ncbi:hypothetical protein ACU4HD_14320 [Cupriavidus basilensis]
MIKDKADIPCLPIPSAMFLSRTDHRHDLRPNRSRRQSSAELRTLAAHLTAGSLLQAATLQLIAEQEKSPHGHAPARIAELSRPA